MPDRYRRLAADSTGQLGAFTRRQADAAGITSSELRGQVQSGLLEPFGARTLRPTLVPPTPLGDLHAYVLDIGPPCWVAGSTVAAVHRLDGFGFARPYHFLVPRGRFVRRHGAVIHTSDTIDPIDTEEIDGLPVLSPVRALIDVARTLSRSRLTEVIDGALRDGLVSEDLLHRRIVALRASGRPGIPRLAEALEGAEVTRGGHSWLERRYLWLLDGAGLPRPRTQQHVARRGNRLVRVDYHFPDAALVVEVLGYRWHRSQAQMRADAERANAIVLSGGRCLQFVYRQLVDDPVGVIATTRAGLARS